MKAQIKSIEFIYPQNKITNQDLSKEFQGHDFSDFENKIGIGTRYIVNKTQSALDLAEEVCCKIFEYEDKNSIDYLIYCTQSPEYILPTSACILQDRLGLGKNIGAYDFNLGCSGFIYGLGMAKAFIESGQAKNVLLVTSETYSKFIHPKDRSNRAIFGDAATCTIISESSDGLGLCNFSYGTDGSGYDNLIIKNGSGRFPYNNNAEEKTYGTGNIYSENHLYMNGPEIFNFTSKNIPPFTRNLLTLNDLEITQIDQFIFHQANAFMLNFMRKQLKVNTENFFIDLFDGANTVSNTIPIALKKYSQKLSDQAIEKIALVGFGVGLSWGGCVLELNKKL